MRRLKSAYPGRASPVHSTSASAQVRGHKVQHAEQSLLAEEMTAVVDMDAAPPVPGGVFDLDERELLPALVVNCRELLKGFLCIEGSRRIGTRNHHAVRRHGQTIALGRNRRISFLGHGNPIGHPTALNHLLRLRHKHQGRQ